MRMSNTKIRIAGTGVATLDLYLNRGRMYPGGNEYNVVCHAIRNGAEAGFLGVFGNDRAGEILEETLVDLGVDISMSRHEIGSSGYSLVTIKDDGDRVFLDWNRKGVTDLYPFEFTEEEIEYIRSYDVLSAGKLADVSLEKLELLASSGISICYDFHASFDDEEINAVSPHIDYGFFSCSHLNDEEIYELLEKAVEAGCKLAVGTRGCEPVVVYDGSEFHVRETLRVEPTDTLGAGDSFIAAFLTSYLTSIKAGKTVGDAVDKALIDATEYSAGVVIIEGSLGMGYDIESDELADLVNVESCKLSELMAEQE